MNEYYWVGSENHFMDTLSVQKQGNITIGRFGGNSLAGQVKNEDGCLIWQNEQEDWEFVILLDAHHTAESAKLIVQEFSKRKGSLKSLLSGSPKEAFKNIEDRILQIFQNPEFLASCRKVNGSTSCLIVLRKDKYIWWFSVGDCILYLFHPELAKLGQYQVNQRRFFEWIGQVNTFELPVPCYSSGRKELRKGNNHLFLTTDGLIECPGLPYNHPEKVQKEFLDRSNEYAVQALLKKIQSHNVRDSTTIISWFVESDQEASLPCNQ
ncbi:protein phosphatase 2C domain-containing protein [Bacillus timonensis]|uniref:Protein phosphatase 2C domain-containing protein n=1 Tax=Bacillus timonensis TaxID=1033734 RepID=A0A4S3PYH1_9BACI|nr:protein phosphatase 2C domain-containing protein [Bacillus timonensis]THE14132.1 protein phosphatase 2C domain-containing protein [Bacillus timonensis]